ncbi:MAG: type II toxin-antitoxin system RelE/ParE family toxin [Lachnospiraceae bacterium]|nr:type II toxin-antitoxin system RelE/ParE family toxin [Lachnospiraceae bacterium]
MRAFQVVVTDDAKADFLRYRNYLIYVKKNSQAARNLLNDYIETRKKLEMVAESLKEPDSESLLSRGLKRINFMRHNYFLLYKVEGKRVFVTNMFHDLENYENKLR